MKEIFFLFSLLFTFIGATQKSYEFTIALPPETEAVNVVASTYFGDYKMEGEFPYYEVNASGIYLHSLAIHSISRDTIRESSKFQIKGDYIFGILENDSLPCVLDGEYYFFGVPKREMIAGRTSKNQLKQIAKNEYILNFSENGNFIPCRLRFENKKMKISYFDYTSGENKTLDAIKRKQEVVTNGEASLQLVLLLPTQKEWTKLLQTGIFGEVIEYSLK